MIRLEVLMPTGRRQGQIMMEYKRLVSISSAKSANQNVAGLSKISDLAWGRKIEFFRPL
jgi:hypothetical protein